MTQSWNPTVYAEVGAFVPALGAGVLEWLAPQPGERILDLGCGEGQLTAKIAAAGAKVFRRRRLAGYGRGDAASRDRRAA